MKVIAINVAAILGILFLFEGGIRAFVRYNPAYYVGAKAVGSCMPHPYGEVCFNSLGYPDDEFDMASTKPRVGYFGDSVCYGVGAGRRYRMTDILKEHYREFAHFNFCNIGDNPLSDQTLGNIRKFAEGFRLSHVVVLMNLNDIPPTMAEHQASHAMSSQTQEVNHAPQNVPWTVMIKQGITPIDLQLRGVSYLYTHVRNLIKERLTIAGYGVDGYQSIELFPQANSEAFRLAAEKLNKLERDLRSQGVVLRVVLVPYEMQISADAAKVYRQLHIEWEAGFEDCSAQKLIAASLAPNMPIFNTCDAFNGYRDKTKVGELFVYDKGDKLDWNHPNREGHRLIADYLIRNHFLPQA